MIDEIYQHFILHPSVTTDTRKLKKGDIFFALKGPNFNGNDYAVKALEAGASLVISDEQPPFVDSRIIVVEDALVSLQALATKHRQQFEIPVIAITGSNGKTSTKELLVRVLETRFNVSATKGNLNNQIGVPLTLLELNNGHDIVVIEMGASKLGDIQELVDIARPTHGIITNIGLAHVETFGSRENILRGKSELFQYLRKENGLPFINALQDDLRNMGKRFDKAVTFPFSEDTYPLKFVEANPFVSFEFSGKQYASHLAGEHHFNTIATAMAVGQYFGISGTKVAESITKYKPDNNRSQIISRNGNQILLDAYNANPASMIAAINVMDKLPAPRLLILGDMLELGSISSAEHRKIGERVKTMEKTTVLLIGKEMKAAHINSDFYYFDEKESLIRYLKEMTISGYHILIKGSRGMQMESIVEYLK